MTFGCSDGLLATQILRHITAIDQHFAPPRLSALIQLRQVNDNASRPGRRVDDVSDPPASLAAIGARGTVPADGYK